MERIKKQARNNVDSGLAGLKKWWSKKYQLPANHPLFLKQSISDLNLEMYEDWYLRRDELLGMIDSSDYGMEMLREAQRELDGLNKALGEESTGGDDLIDKWERELAEGRTPDLSEGL